MFFDQNNLWNFNIYIYIYILYINSVSLSVCLSEWTEPHFFQDEAPFLHSSKIHEEVFRRSSLHKHTHISFLLSVHLSVCDGVLEGGGGRGRWSMQRATTTVSAPARCTNQDLISTNHRSRPKGRNDGRIASLSHRTRGGYKNLPLPPPLPKEPTVIWRNVFSEISKTFGNQGSKC
jgi:hypothetical protein